MIITAGIYKGRKIQAPDEKITRPTLSKVRMGVFNSLYSILGEFDGLSFLDMFGGSGIMGLEALSRGFAEVKVFEINKKSAEIIKKNYNTLKVNPNLVVGDSLKLYKKLNKKYNVIYFDPPYMSENYNILLPILIADVIIVEHSEDVDFEGFEVIKTKNYGGKQVTFLHNLNR